MMSLIAHTLIGFFFVFFGFWNLYHWRPTMEAMNQKNLPHPWLLLPVGIAWETVFGFMIILGFYVKIAALLLIPFTIISTLIFHPFWKLQGEEKRLNLVIFISNFTVCLGTLFLLLNSVTPLMQFSDLMH